MHLHTLANRLALAATAILFASTPLHAAPPRNGVTAKAVQVDALRSAFDLFYLEQPADPFVTLSIDCEDRRAGYVAGERFRVTISASADCFITLLSWGPSGEVTQIAPSQAVSGSDEALRLAKGERLVLPKGGAAFRAEAPHGETHLRVIATDRPIRIPLPKESPTKEIAVDEGEPNPFAGLFEGVAWSVADRLVMTGADRKDLAERMGVSEEEAIAPRPAPEAGGNEDAPRVSLDDLLLEKPDAPRADVPRPARRNPAPPLAPASGNAAIDEYAARWKRVLAGEPATKSLRSRFVQPPPMQRAPRPAADMPTDLLVVRVPPAGSKSAAGSRFLTERVPLVPPGSKATGSADEAVRRRIAELRAADGSIRTVIPNRSWSVFAADDNLFRGLQWHLANQALSGNDIGWFAKSVEIMETSPALIGMVDQGIHLSEPRLLPFVAINAGERPDNGVDDDGNGLVDDVHGWNFASGTNALGVGDEQFNHGSYCSSIIVGGPLNSPEYFFPVAYEPRIVVAASVAWDEAAGTARGSIESTLAAIEYVMLRGAKVINLSLGGPSTELELMLLSAHPLFDELERRGVLLVIAAGNENQDIDASPVSPAGIDRPNTIVVMATDPDGRPARGWDAGAGQWVPYTNWGRNRVHIAAPGTMILGIPQVGATSYGDGTSYATPIVTAAAAILMGKHPEWDVATVRRAILETARQVEGLDERCQTGGMLDLKAALEWAP
jgi:hypothetical protein